MNQLCDDLGLEPHSIQRAHLLTHVRDSVGSYLNKNLTRGDLLGWKKYCTVKK